MRTGQCQCTAIRFEFDGEPSDASFCHCSICRKQSGSAFAAYVEVGQSNLRISAGADGLSEYAITPRLTRQFCANCGTTMFLEHASFPGYVYICLGVLDDQDDIVPEYHQFTGSKAKWYTISDGLRQFEEWSEE